MRPEGWHGDLRKLLAAPIGMLLVASSLVILPTAPASAVPEEPYPAGFWTCSGGSCPDRDNSVNVFVGGDMSVVSDAAESGGLTVVRGDYGQNKSGSTVYNIGDVVGGEGGPENGRRTWEVGGSVNIAAGQRVEFFNTQHTGAYTGTLNGNVPGSVHKEAGIAAAYSEAQFRLGELSQCLAEKPATGTVATGGSRITFTGDGVSTVQTFNYAGSIGDAPNEQWQITFANIGPGQTVVVNMTGTDSVDLVTYSGATSLEDRLLWNFPFAKAPNLTGAAQFDGSVLIGNEASNAIVDYSGLDGRFYTVGNLQHGATGGPSGDEFHDRDFIGNLDCGSVGPVPLEVQVRAAKTDLSGTPLPGATMSIARMTALSGGETKTDVETWLPNPPGGLTEAPYVTDVDGFTPFLTDTLPAGVSQARYCTFEIAPPPGDYPAPDPNTAVACELAISGISTNLTLEATNTLLQVVPVTTQATPSAPSPSVPVGGEVSDTITIPAVGAPPPGTVMDVALHGPFATSTNPVCDASTMVAGTQQSFTITTAPQEFTAGPVTVAQPGWYSWQAHIPPTADTAETFHGCGVDSEMVEALAGTPEIASRAWPRSEPALVGTPVYDAVVVSGLPVGYEGTATTSLYGPYTDPGVPICTGAPVHTESAPINGNALLRVGPWIASAPGYYAWVTSITADDSPFSPAATSACGEATEVVQVVLAPEVTTTSNPVGLVAVGTPLTDSVTVSGVDPSYAVTGTATLYGPFADMTSADCDAGPVVGTANVIVNGNGTFTSGPVTVGTVGTYTWQIDLPASGAYAAVTTGCPDSTETVTAQVPPSITTDAQVAVVTRTGANLSDSVTVSGHAGPMPVTANLYGPFTTNDPASFVCDAGSLVPGSPATGSVPGATSPESVVVGPIAVTAPGYYTWVAATTGNGNTLPAENLCGEAPETVTVPTMTSTAAVANVTTTGAEVSEVVTVTGNIGPVDVTAQLFGPYPDAASATCAAGTEVGAPQGPEPIASGGGSATLGPVTVTASGWYTWVASTTANADTPAMTHACALPSETVEVVLTPLAVPAITTEAQDAVVTPTGADLSDVVTVEGNVGDVMVSANLYGPFVDAASVTCAVAPIGTTAAVTVPDGGGTVTVGPIEVTEPGVYTWVASSTGNEATSSATHACGLALETVTVEFPEAPTGPAPTEPSPAPPELTRTGASDLSAFALGLVVLALGVAMLALARRRTPRD